MIFTGQEFHLSFKGRTGDAHSGLSIRLTTVFVFEDPMICQDIELSFAMTFPLEETDQAKQSGVVERSGDAQFYGSVNESHRFKLS